MAQYSNLVGHNIEKFGMVTVLDATFYDVVSGAPLLHFDTLKMSNISSEGQQKEIRGGQGAELLLTYDFGRTANIEITDALASMYSLEYLWGGTIDKTSTFTYPKRKEGIIVSNTISDIISTGGTIGTVSGTGPYTATISGLSASLFEVGDILTATNGVGSLGSGVVTVVGLLNTTEISVSSTATMTAGTITNIKRKVYELDINTQISDLKGKGTLSTVFYGTVGTQSVTFKVTTTTAGAEKAQAGVRKNSELSSTSAVVYYKVDANTSAAHVHELTLTSVDFPPIVKLVGDTFLIDQDTGKKIPMQIEIPRFKINSNFSFTLEAEGDASVFDFSGVALSDNGNILIMRTLGEI